MAATGIGNPAGAIVVADGACPRIITGLARETISGGVFVYASGAGGVVSSGADSLATGDILFCKDASGLLFNGIALATAGSNTPIAVATRGTFIVVANGNVVAGMPVTADGNNSALQSTGANKIGRAVTEGTSGGYIVIDIQG
jgi:hypothetical protein